MFSKKPKYEDEKQPIPVIWTIVIAIVVISVLVIGTYKITEIAERHDMELQYNCRVDEDI